MSEHPDAALPPHVSSTRRLPLPSLTGSRIIAALGVLLFHASLGKMLNPYADPATAGKFSFLVSKMGWVGVSYFFVLSGFIMVWSAREGDTALAYYRRRVAKIYPVHAVTWALAMLMGATSLVRSDIWLPNLLLVNSWIPRLEVFVSVNQPSWSLCVEMFFYLIFPLLFAALACIRASRLVVLAASCFVALAATQVVIATAVPSSPVLAEWPLSERQWWLSYNFPPLRMFEFVAGMAVARIVIEGRWRGPGVAGACLMLLLGYVVALFLPFQLGLNLATLVPIMLLIPALALADTRGRRTVLSARPMVWLGEISFGFYMIHFLVLIHIKDMLDGRRFDFMTGTALIALACIVSVAGGWLLYRYVELPMTQMFGKQWPKFVRFQKAPD